LEQGNPLPTPVPHTEGVGAGDADLAALREELFRAEYKPIHEGPYVVASDHAQAVWHKVMALLAADRAAARAEGAREVVERVTGWVCEFIIDHDVEHNEGCEGEADCIACVLLDVLRAALTDPAPDTTASEEER
jgi:hypothetical protein